MRILVTSPHCRPDWINKLGQESQGGQSVVMNKLYASMAEVDKEVSIDIFTRLQNSDPFSKKPVYNLSDRVRIIRLTCGDPDKYVVKEKLYGEHIDEFVNNILQFSKSANMEYDILHGHYADGWETVYKLSQITKTPYVLSTHSLGKRKKEDLIKQNQSEEDMKSLNFDQRIKSEEVSIKNCSGMHPLSTYEAKYLKENYKSIRDCPFLKVMPNGIDPRDFKEIDSKKAEKIRSKYATKDEFLLFMPSRVDPRKGQLTALKAIDYIINKKGVENFKLIWTWISEEENGGYVDQLLAFIKENNLKDHICNIGSLSRDDIIYIFGVSDAVILPSQEYFSISMLESMYLKKPILCSKFSSAPDLIKQGYNGFMFDHNNIEEVSQNLEEVIKVGDRARKTIGSRAHDTVRKHYIWPQIAKDWINLYKKIIVR